MAVGLHHIFCSLRPINGSRASARAEQLFFFAPTSVGERVVPVLPHTGSATGILAQDLTGAELTTEKHVTYNTII